MGTLLRNGRVEAVVDASPGDVWAVVADVTRTGEWSHECQDVAWIDGATAAAPGARFRGHNHTGRSSWNRVCEVVEVDAPRELAWRTVPDWKLNDSTIWRIRVEPMPDGGTRIVQTFEVVKLSKVMDHLFWLLVPAHRDRRPALTEDMHRLGLAAARSAEPARQADEAVTSLR